MSRPARGTALALALLLAACAGGHVVPPPTSGAGVPPPLALVIVDGLDARDLTDARGVPMRMPQPRCPPAPT